MAITYLPDKMLAKAAPESKIKKMMNKNTLSLKKTALSFVDNSDVISKKEIKNTALKVIKNYKERVKDETADKSDLAADPVLLIQRVQNEVVLQVAQGIKETYIGEQYVWLPSDADEPDPEHQLNYGKVFTIGDGEMPGDRYGCRCGMEILVKDTKLDL